MITESVQQAMKQYRIQTILAVITSIFIIGCGAGPQALATDEIQKSTDKAQTARQIFNTAEGDFAKVSEGDKKKLMDLYGDQKSIDIVWSGMKNPPIGGGPQSGAPMPTGN